MKISKLLLVSVVALLGWLAPNQESTIPQDSAVDIGELARYEGAWIINEDRRSTRVVFSSDDNTLQTYTSEYRQNFGCPYTLCRSMQMTYNPDSKTYQAKIKWSGHSIEEHNREPWLDYDLLGVWNDDSQTMIWKTESPASAAIPNLKITTKFLGEDKQTLSIEKANGQVWQKIAGATFHRLY